MDYDVPEYQGFAGIDGDLRALDDYYFTPELLELLLPEDDGGFAGSSVARENPSPIDLPPSSPLPTYYAAGNPSGEVIASDAEMASWLCQIYEQEAPDDHKPRGAATATTTEGGNTAPRSCGGTATVGTPTTSVAAGGAAEGRHGQLSSGRRRSCSGKAAEQRRRDKINDKMRTLQQLIPRCSKTDKVSTLEEVIKYTKSLQHQVQVMSAIPTTPIFPPPSCMRLPGWQAPAMMPPRYPVFPTVYACAHHGTPLPLSAPAPHTGRHQVEPARSSGGRQQLIAPRRRTSCPERPRR
ncbi:uncharacterized protein [Aegilops tauschii subsp. strangulata]|uniref:uncharacterized protein isoform X2 n=1 Tax=Aegilops tauschii subsp. strangulata TaxID=200361 RepID=UPI001ABC41BB|nr:transcription factor bHLH127-like isoform X2 [Aegilops tauschii subsp. strangulata]